MDRLPRLTSSREHREVGSGRNPVVYEPDGLHDLGRQRVEERGVLRLDPNEQNLVATLLELPQKERDGKGMRAIDRSPQENRASGMA